MGMKHEFLLTMQGFVLFGEPRQELQQCVGTKLLCKYLEMSPLHKQDHRDSHQLISIPAKPLESREPIWWLRDIGVL